MSEVFLQDDIHIAELKDRHFLIPSYQRGYKWRPRDVEYLLNDLLEYKDKKPYYMQPLVVAEKGGKHIVVDGQQRLTTFFLIWRRIAKHGYFTAHPFDETTCFSLEYEKRRYSTKYLSMSYSDIEESTNTPDIKNFKKAEEKVDEIVKLLNEPQIEHLEKNFFEKATFLWYQLGDPDAGPKMFERLNGKRIALTDVELCKVFLLSDTCSSSSLRNERASAWQNMEYRLQDNRFFSFISKDYDESHDQSRMGFILDVALSKIKKENSEYLDYPLYNRLKSDSDKGKNVWRGLIQTFHRIEQMFDNPLYYNFVGFLITEAKVKLSDILEDAVTMDFGRKLVDRIKVWVDHDTSITELTYNHPKTYAALVLFNILCDLIVKDSKSEKIEDRFSFYHRFRFDFLHSEGFDKEHVHATNSRKPQSALEWQQWVKNIKEYLPKKQYEQIKEDNRSIMESVINISITQKPGEEESVYKDRVTKEIIKKMSSSKFSEIFDEVMLIVGEEDDGDAKQNSIGNMALLNASINRDQAYAASPFAIKRAIIHQRVKNGKFVPKGTQLMFDKSFREVPDEMYHWAKNNYANGAESDKDSFIKFFSETINMLRL